MSDLIPSPFKVAAIHAAPVFLDLDRTVEKAVGLIEEAGHQGARVVVFPEAFIPGFPYWVNLSSVLFHGKLFVRLWENSIDLSSDAAVIRPLQDAARQAGAVVIMGFNERAGGTLYNGQLFIDQDGQILGARRKLVPTLAERTVWGYGNGSTLRVWDTAFGKIGGLMCWEHSMNLARQALIAQGIQIHASSWPGLSSVKGYDPVFQMQVEALTKSHALTGQCFVIVAMNPVNQDVFEVMEPYIGETNLMQPGPAWSAIIHPLATLIATETGDKDAVLCAEINLRHIISTKYLVDSVGHYSRPEVLSLVVDQTDYQPAKFINNDGLDGSAQVDTEAPTNGRERMPITEQTKSPSSIPGHAQETGPGQGGT